MTCITWPSRGGQLTSWGFLITNRVCEWVCGEGGTRGGKWVKTSPLIGARAPLGSARESTVQLAHRLCSCSSSWPLPGLVGSTPERRRRRRPQGMCVSAFHNKTIKGLIRRLWLCCNSYCKHQRGDYWNCKSHTTLTAPAWWWWWWWW